MSSDGGDKEKKRPKVLLDLELKRPRVRPKLPPEEAPPVPKPGLELQRPEPALEPDPPADPAELEALVPDTMRRQYYRSEEVLPEEEPPPSIELHREVSEPTIEEDELAVEVPEEPPESAFPADPPTEQPRWRRWLAPATAAAVCLMLVVGNTWFTEPGPPGPVTLDQIVPAAAPPPEELVIEDISPAAQMDPVPEPAEEPVPELEPVPEGEPFPPPPDDDVAALPPPDPVAPPPPAAEPPPAVMEDTVVIEEEISALPPPSPAAPPAPQVQPPAPKPPPAPAPAGRSGYEIAEPSF